jgi:hydroxyethylthiazole kinase
MEELIMLGTMLENVRDKSPLVHSITNYVTVNDCANVLLACGASPIMADDEAEVEQITALCGGLALNIGTLNRRTIASMFSAGKKAAQLHHPVVFDPVGAGASDLRTQTARQILDEVPLTAIRANASELKALAHAEASTKGVDANEADAAREDTLGQAVAFAKAFAKQSGAVVAVTGAIDVVTDGDKAYVIRNGHPMMAKVTGTGCMLTALCAAYLAANPDQPLEATAAAVCAMGLCGQVAHKQLKDGEGNASYRMRLIDAMYCLTGDALNKGAIYEIR